MSSPTEKAATRAADLASEATVQKLGARAARQAAAVAAAGDVVPVVVETAELALEVPTQVVLKQPLIVIASVAGGVVLGVAGLWAVNKFRNRNKPTVTILDDDTDEDNEVN